MKRIVLALVLANCATAPKPIPPPPPCILAAPPAPPKIVLAGPADGCPAGFSVCLTTESAVALDAYIDALKDWSHNAWINCGPQ